MTDGDVCGFLSVERDGVLKFHLAYTLATLPATTVRDRTLTASAVFSPNIYCKQLISADICSRRDWPRKRLVVVVGSRMIGLGCLPIKCRPIS